MTVGTEIGSSRNSTKGWNWYGLPFDRSVRRQRILGSAYFLASNDAGAAGERCIADMVFSPGGFGFRRVLSDTWRRDLVKQVLSGDESLFARRQLLSPHGMCVVYEDLFS